MADTWDSIDRYVVISTDTHAGADLYDYKPYLPTRLHDEFDAWAKTYVSPFDDLVVATARELLANAAQHARASRVVVAVAVVDGAVRLTVADDGAGFGRDADRPRREIAYMRRRVAGLRGTVELDTAQHWGTSITCELPLHGPPLAPETPAAERIAQLRARECEVLELMVGGLRNRDIADRLFITVRTVKFHVSNILRKLDVQSRTEAIALAHAAGISAPDES